ncbi:MAG: metalloregulator ArsR/SmtB family transcription factor [Caldisericia bacterium]|nr:metalloregulator ArsR/SmtB family transcription factor [Caldisericia bacterium]
MESLLLIFKALSDRNRLRILHALVAQKELCACQITELIQVTNATASRHMGVLINANLVQRRKKGRWVYYQLHTENQGVENVFTWIEKKLKEDPEALLDLISLEEITRCGPEEICKKHKTLKFCSKQ